MPLALAAAALIALVIGISALCVASVGESHGPIPGPTTQPRSTPSATAVDPRLGPDPVTSERMAVVRQHLTALNAGNNRAFIDAFLPEAVFTPGGDFRGGSSLFANSLAVADVSLVEAWMAIHRAWGFEAEIVACNQDPGAAIVYGYGEGQGDPMVVNCEVAARWHRLSLEITQRWSYEFHGAGLGHWAFGLLDLNPAEREMPLGYDGLEEWEAWLAATDPAAARRYLNPRTLRAPCLDCRAIEESLASEDPDRAARLTPLVTTAQNDWSIRGDDFSPFGLIPYNPAFAGEIEASIRAYLEELQP